MTATKIVLYAEDRAALRSLFRLADDSDKEIESYLRRGSVLVAIEGDEIVGHIQIVDTDVMVRGWTTSSSRDCSRSIQPRDIA